MDPPPLWWWIAPFALQALLTAFVLYSLVLLSELENDLLNPHECASRLNKLVAPELVVLGVQTAAYAVSGRWLMFVLNAALLAVYALRHRRGTAYVDVTELVNTLRAHKKERIVRLCVCAGLLLLVIGRLVEHALWVATTSPKVERSTFARV